jgi:hypothetical protein
MPSPRQLAKFMLVFQACSVAVWLTMTVITQLTALKQSIGYLTFVSNWALFASSLAGVVAAMSALRAEQHEENGE